MEQQWAVGVQGQGQARAHPALQLPPVPAPVGRAVLVEGSHEDDENHSVEQVAPALHAEHALHGSGGGQAGGCRLVGWPW